MLGGGPSQWPCSGGAGRSEEEEEEEGERWSVVLLSGALRTVSMCVCVCVHACVCLCKYVYMCEKIIKSVKYNNAVYSTHYYIHH